MTRMLALLLTTAGLSLALAGPAGADFSFERIAINLWGPAPQEVDAGGNPVFATNPLTNQPYPRYEAHGPFSRQAGAHPDFNFSFNVLYDPDVVIGGEPSPGPREAAHTVDLDLPVGLVGDPTGIATCDPLDLASPGYGGAKCPVASQVGIARVVTAGPNAETTAKVGLFNIAHGPDVPARFGFNVYGVVSTIDARLRPSDYGISSGSFAISQGEAVRSADITLWGVPADRSHDQWRQPSFTGQIPGPFDGPSPIPISTDARRVPFLSLPTSCSSAPVSFTARGDSWEHQGVFDTRTLTADGSGTPFIISGCERPPFKPTIDVQPLSRSADAPSGLTVDLSVPQVADPDGLATAHVRRVVMTMPEGMSVSPSSAAGLGACSPAQIGLGTNAAPTCPDSSKLGKVTIDTPLLDDPLIGDVLLASQSDNPFGSLIALYVAVKGPGFYVKLPGRIDLDPATGRIKATFDNTPQVPFSRMLLELSGGSQAPLATPTECGSYTTHTEITSWASDTPVALDSPMTINQNCTAKAFAPSFTAGTTNLFAGRHSSFILNLTRPDGMPFLSRVETALPKGLLADISAVPQCGAGPAADGSCPSASKVGTTSVLSGPGGQPLGLTGSVYLTGPYKDAPFGLSIAVPTAGQAGPFDLGTVVVRAGIYVDRKDARITV